MRVEIAPLGTDPYVEPFVVEAPTRVDAARGYWGEAAQVTTIRGGVCTVVVDGRKVGFVRRKVWR